ncbi:MAG: CBS domain-containing protein [Candidatus Verstraetearchaeota archaeon]|nr:CBS domain-containing protein [Candidatus Verstraetearchaeota archaeon]
MTFLVKDYMRKDIITVDSGVSIHEAVKIMKNRESDYLIVLKDGNPIGIITEEDLVRKVLAEERDPRETSVDEVMTSPLITIEPEACLSEAAELMGERNVRKIPVVKDGVIYGIITSKEIAKYFNKYIDRIVKDIVKFRPIIF